MSKGIVCRLRPGTILLLGVVWGAAAQSPAPDKTLTFEVASVKPFSLSSPSAGRKGGGGPSGPGTADPGRIHYPAMRLKVLILNAYGIQDFELIGPEWLNDDGESTRFAIDATMPATTTREQLRVMLQNLLADRFKLAVHRETRDVPQYSLVVAKGGPRLKEAAEYQPPKDGMPPPRPGPDMGPFDRYGFPIHPATAKGGTWSWMINGRSRLGGERATMQDLVTELMRGHERVLVTDDTGLKGKYDFLLTYSRPRAEGLPDDMPGWVTNPPELSESLPELFGAIQAQLGLKLEAKKAPGQVIVIDHLEKKPTGN